MKKTNLIIVLLLFFFEILNPQDTPQQIFQKQILVIESIYNGNVIDGKKLNDAVAFLEDVTGIKSDVDYGEPPLISPSEANLKSWKRWYKKNKKRLYWDEKDKKVKVEKG